MILADALEAIVGELRREIYLGKFLHFTVNIDLTSFAVYEQGIVRFDKYGNVIGQSSAWAGEVLS